MQCGLEVLSGRYELYASIPLDGFHSTHLSFSYEVAVFPLKIIQLLYCHFGRML